MTERTYAYVTSDTDGDIRIMKSDSSFEYFVDDVTDSIDRMMGAVYKLVDSDKPAVYRISINIEKVFEIP